jgi:hypothetical protein
LVLPEEDLRLIDPAWIITIGSASSASSAVHTLQSKLGDLAR